MGRYGSGGKVCLAVGGLPVWSHPGRVEVSLSKTHNPQLLLTSWLVPCMLIQSHEGLLLTPICTLFLFSVYFSHNWMMCKDKSTSKSTVLSLLHEHHETLNKWETQWDVIKNKCSKKTFKKLSQRKTECSCKNKKKISISNTTLCSIYSYPGACWLTLPQNFLKLMCFDEVGPSFRHLFLQACLLFAEIMSGD